MSLEREREREGKREGKKERERERGGSERVERREKMVDSKFTLVCMWCATPTNPLPIKETKQKITKQPIRHQFIKFPQPKLSA